MTTKLNIRKVGNSLGTTFPKEALKRLEIKEGDELFMVETLHGWMITPYDPQFEKAMKISRKGMKKYREAMKELAQ